MLKLREVREKKGLSQGALSRKSGIPQSTISDIERGIIKSPTINLAQKLARALGVPLSEMLDENDIVENSTA